MWGYIQRSSVVTPVVPEHVALATAGAFLLLALATSVQVPVAVVGGILVATALLVGPSAALGGASGLVLHDLFRAGVGVWTLAVAVWLCVFVGLLAVFAPGVAGGRARAAVRMPPRAVRPFVGAVIVAGTYATAVSAWISSVTGGGRFYTSAADLLPGVVVAALLGVAVLVVARRFDGAVSVSRPNAPARPGRLVLAGLFVVGVAWLVGAIGIDLLGHDLGLFPTETQLEYYIAGLLGSGSLVSTVGSAVLVGVYRYSEVAVFLSAPLAALLSWGLFRLDRDRIPAPTPDIDLGHGGADSD